MTTSAVANSSSLGTHVAPASAARSGVRFWLHAITRMSKAWPIRATWVPSRPSPSTPSVLPARSVPTVVCQRPSRTARSSVTTCRRTARISAQVSSVVFELLPEPYIVVPLTVTPCTAAAVMSIAALAIPVVTSRRRSGNRSNVAARNGVRSRIATTTSAPRSAAASPSRSAMCSCNTSTSASASESNGPRVRATRW